MSQRMDLTGLRFGRLTALERTVVFQGKPRTAWVCMCDCGCEVTVVQDNLTSGRTRSCGCLAKELLSHRQKTHGESESRLYGIWLAMRRRCNLPTSTAYMDYGGRGINVCDAWNDSFEAFRDWANSSGYASDLTIDRVDVNGDYDPSNCRWVDVKTQSNNRRSCVWITIDGETHNLSQWCEIYNLPYKRIHNRYRNGWPVDKLFT